MAFVIVVTANHFIVDALLGALTAGVSAYGARWLARARPAVWRFSGASASAPASARERARAGPPTPLRWHPRATRRPPRRRAARARGRARATRAPIGAGRSGASWCATA